MHKKKPLHRIPDAAEHEPPPEYVDMGMDIRIGPTKDNMVFFGNGNARRLGGFKEIRFPHGIVAPVNVYRAHHERISNERPLHCVWASIGPNEAERYVMSSISFDHVHLCAWGSKHGVQEESQEEIPQAI